MQINEVLSVCFDQVIYSLLCERCAEGITHLNGTLNTRRSYGTFDENKNRKLKTNDANFSMKDRPCEQ